MNDGRRDCSWWLQAIQQGLDGELDAERAEALEVHLTECSSCRELEVGLRATANALAEIPQLVFPDEALEQVWDRTVRAPRPRRHLGWVAAAAVLLVALAGFWALQPTTPDQVEQLAWQQEEITPEEAAAQTRKVLEYLSVTLRRTESAAVGVVADEVSPALRKIPFTLPATPPAPNERSDS